MRDEKQETIEDIVSEMREYESTPPPRDAWPAWRAERESAEADALVVGGMVEAMRNEKRGNAAAIREALVRCADIINKFGLAEIITTPMEVICDIEGIITAALSAPPRNCDIYDAESCRMAYHLHGDGLMTMQAFADWLFAPAEEGGAS